MEDVIRLYVWGTLKSKNYRHYVLQDAEATFVRKADYPGFPEGGEVWDVPIKHIKTVDAFEAQWDYRREVVDKTDAPPVEMYTEGPKCPYKGKEYRLRLASAVAEK